MQLSFHLTSLLRTTSTNHVLYINLCMCMYNLNNKYHEKVLHDSFVVGELALMLRSARSHETGASQ